MDNDAVRKKRQEELEEKRRKLEEMKKARAASKAEPTTPPSTAAAAAVAATSTAFPPVPPAPTPVVQPAAVAAAAPVVVAPVRPVVPLSTSRSNPVSILPVTVVSYDKGCQTEEEEPLPADRDSPALPVVIEDDVPAPATPVHFADAPSAARKPTVVVDEVQLNKFLSHASLWVERALEQSAASDILRDYTCSDEASSNESHLFDHLLSYEDEAIKDRPIVEIHWSPHMSELFLVSYGAKLASRGVPVKEEATGLLYVWSKDLHSRPEFRFVTSSPVLCATFHSVEQHLIIGGCYNGQVVIWDMRVPKENPVQRSSISGRGHKHPICAVSTSSVSSELLTISTDGMLCQWDSSRLSEPLSVVNLSLPSLSAQPSAQPSSSSWLDEHSSAQSMAALNLSSLAFGRTESTSFALIGCGDGQLLRVNLQNRSVTDQQSSAHYGMVTAVIPHPTKNKKFGSLLLTSSLDWSVKLWNADSLAEPLLEMTSTSYDYITDVQWSPVYPTVFATISSGGTLSVWNLSRSTAAPIDSLAISVKVDEAVDVKNGGPTATLNKALWASDGASILVGDAVGVIHRIKVNTALLVSGADDGSFEAVLSKHKE